MREHIAFPALAHFSVSLTLGATLEEAVKTITERKVESLSKLHHLSGNISMPPTDCLCTLRLLASAFRYNKYTSSNTC